MPNEKKRNPENPSKSTGGELKRDYEIQMRSKPRARRSLNEDLPTDGHQALGRLLECFRV